MAAIVVAGAGGTAYVSQSAQRPVDAVATVGQPLVKFQPINVAPAHVVSGVEGPREKVSSAAGVTSAIQEGLTRARCYDGPTNGVWSPKSKEAMRRFVTAANAQLPVDTPDQVLLALVQSNDAVTCSAAQMPDSGSAQALPNFVLPDTQKKIQTSLKTPDAPRSSDMPITLSESSSTSTAAVADDSDRLTSDTPDRPADTVAAKNVTPISAASVGNGINNKTEAGEPSKNQKIAQRRVKYQKQKSTTINGVSKSISKSVKSIQRTFVSLFN